ncbi:MAG: RimK/LysX family protein [Candidatus Nanoarchaeia archaeon]
MTLLDKTVVGLTEKVTIRGKNGRSRTLVARIDTGATKSSIDESLAVELDLGPVIATKVIRQAQGKQRRPVIRAKLKIKNRTVEGEFTVADRSHMRYPILVGQNMLCQNFLVDPSMKEPEK